MSASLQPRQEYGTAYPQDGHGSHEQAASSSRGFPVSPTGEGSYPSQGGYPQAQAYQFAQFPGNQQGEPQGYGNNMMPGNNAYTQQGYTGHTPGNQPVPLPSSAGLPTSSNIPVKSPPDEEDLDNRTRNAKAQKRHREKRKAHVKHLEDTVTSLQHQIRALGRSQGIPDPSYPGAPQYPFYPQGAPAPLGTVNLPIEQHRQLANQNVYLNEEVNRLRQENEQLRMRLQDISFAQAHNNNQAGNAHSQGRDKVEAVNNGLVEYNTGNQNQTNQIREDVQVPESSSQTVEQGFENDANGQNTVEPGSATYSLNSYAGASGTADR